MIYNRVQVKCMNLQVIVLQIKFTKFVGRLLVGMSQSYNQSYKLSRIISILYNKMPIIWTNTCSILRQIHAYHFALIYRALSNSDGFRKEKDSEIISSIYLDSFEFFGRSHMAAQIFEISFDEFSGFMFLPLEYGRILFLILLTDYRKRDAASIFVLRSCETNNFHSAFLEESASA